MAALRLSDTNGLFYCEGWAGNARGGSPQKSLVPSLERGMDNRAYVVKVRQVFRRCFDEFDRFDLRRSNGAT